MIIGPLTALQINPSTKGVSLLLILPNVLICWCCVWLCVPCGFDFVAGVAHPARVVRQRLAFLSLQARLHLTPPLPNYYGCVHTRWPVSRGSGDFPGQTRTLDRLRTLLNSILITASMSRNYFTRTPLDHVYGGAPRPRPGMLWDGVIESGLTQLNGSDTEPEAQAEQPRHDRTHLLSSPTKSVLCTVSTQCHESIHIATGADPKAITLNLSQRKHQLQQLPLHTLIATVRWIRNDGQQRDFYSSISPTSEKKNTASLQGFHWHWIHLPLCICRHVPSAL